MPELIRHPVEIYKVMQNPLDSGSESIKTRDLPPRQGGYLPLLPVIQGFEGGTTQSFHTSHGNEGGTPPPLACDPGFFCDIFAPKPCGPWFSRGSLRKVFLLAMETRGVPLPLLPVMQGFRGGHCAKFSYSPGKRGGGPPFVVCILASQ